MNLTLKQLKPLACHTRAHCATCRTDADWRENVTGVREFDCPHGVYIKDDVVHESQPPEPSKTQQAKNATKAIATGVASMVKTGILRKGRVTDQEYKDRLNTCTNCPGNHAVFKNGALFTCGEFKNSITGKLPTCGCVLTKKARDIKQDCPQGYWQKLTVDGKDVSK